MLFTKSHSGVSTLRSAYLSLDEVLGTTSLQVMYMPPLTLPPLSKRAVWRRSMLALTLACAYMNIDDEVLPWNDSPAEPLSPTWELALTSFSPVKPAKNSLLAKQEPSLE